MTFNGMLPIGTVVLLKDSTKRLMITGVGQYMAGNSAPQKLYDYVGVVFPEGYLSADENYLFNTEQIDRIYFIGLQDTESIEFSENAHQAIMALKAKTN